MTVSYHSSYLGTAGYWAAIAAEVLCYGGEVEKCIFVDCAIVLALTGCPVHFI